MSAHDAAGAGAGAPCSCPACAPGVTAQTLRVGVDRSTGDVLILVESAEGRTTRLLTPANARLMAHVLTVAADVAESGVVPADAVTVPIDRAATPDRGSN